MRLPSYDITSGLYKTEYADITYLLPFELLSSLKNYYAASRGTIANWFSDLHGEDKKKILRQGISSAKEDNFYPDEPPE